MRRFLVAIGLALALVGCGRGSEDFTVQVTRSPAEVLAVLGDIRTSDAGIVFSGIKLKVSRPNEGELLFSMPTSEYPGHKGEDSQILIRFEPVNNGKGTVLHVAVDVPPVPMRMGQPNMVLSEAKVEKELRKVLVSLGKNLSEREATGSDQTELAKLLVAVAVSSDFNLQAQANQLKNDPARLEGLIEDAVADAEQTGDLPFEAEVNPEESDSAAAQEEPRDDGEAEPAYYDPVDEPDPALE